MEEEVGRSLKRRDSGKRRVAVAWPGTVPEQRAYTGVQERVRLWAPAYVTDMEARMRTPHSVVRVCLYCCDYGRRMRVSTFSARVLCAIAMPARRTSVLGLTALVPRVPGLGSSEHLCSDRAHERLHVGAVPSTPTGHSAAVLGQRCAWHGLAVLVIVSSAMG